MFRSTADVDVRTLMALFGVEVPPIACNGRPAWTHASPLGRDRFQCHGREVAGQTGPRHLACGERGLAENCLGIPSDEAMCGGNA